LSLLRVEEIQKSFGGLVAVNRVSFQIEEGEILGIVGPNGAGKTTLFSLITSYYRTEAGEIYFDDQRVNHLRPDQICLRGLVRTFQHAQPFLDLNVVENVMIGAFARTKDRKVAREKALVSLQTMGLEGKASSLGRDLSPADLKRLEIAKALATDPKLLLLDECMAGLRPGEIDKLIQCIKNLNAKGMTFMVIEHVIRAISSLADRIIVLDYGEKIAEGPPEEIFLNRKVIEAYLGEEVPND
jgi:branched-chain amino acid transport system ATP-binding protein